MKFSINGPLSGSVPIVLTVEKYIDLIRRLMYLEPSQSLARLYNFNTGFAVPDEEDQQLRISLQSLKAYYQFRLRGNTIAYVRVLCDYILARLDMLDDIPQGRGSLDIDTTKAIRYYYNLSRHSAKAIQSLTAKVKRGMSLTEEDFNRLTSRINFEAMSTYSQIGMIGPNPRCDGSVKDLISVLVPKMIGVASRGTKPHQMYAQLLTLFTNLVRLYYGAVNTRDRDPEMLGQNPSILEYGTSGEPLRIGNDVVACLPAPTLDLLQRFHDPQAQVMSMEAFNYVVSLENNYLRRL